MTFYIRADGEAPFWPDMDSVGIVGAIALGDATEAFVVPLVYWDIGDYRRHWREAIAYLIAERQPTCLITEIFGTDADDMIAWWLLYPDDAGIVVQQQLIDIAALTPSFDPSKPWRSIPARESESDGDSCPSEWYVDWASVIKWYSDSAK